MLTLYALFGDDIRIVAFDVNADLGFDVISIIALISWLILIYIYISIHNWNRTECLCEGGLL